jgi:hypothetical protein
VSVALSPQLGVLLHRDRSLYAWAGCDGAGVGIPATHIPLSYRTAVQEYALNAAELPDGDPDAANHLVILTLDDRIWSNKYRLPAFPKPIRHIAATDDAVGVLAEDGTVWVSDARYTPPASVTGIVELAAGDRHFVALTSAGGVVSWGADEANVGVLDVPHDATRDVVQVRAAGHSSAALHSDGTVTIWGEYPTETTAHIAYLNTLGTSGDIFIGAGQIALLMRARAPVVRATATPVALPTGYPENANPVLRANQIGKFSFDGALPATSVSFPGAVYRAGVSATQSTTDGAATAALLIDGVSDTPDRSGVSAATTSETHPWVELDLGTERDIAAVTVYAAQTGTLVDGVQRSDIRRLDGTLVMLSSTSLGDVRGIGTLKAAARTWKCAVSDSQVTGCPDAAHSVETVTFPAGTRARYVRIQSSRTDALIIHEVEVTTAASDYTCTGLLCPAVADELDGTTMTRALRFRDADGHEASSVNSYALTGDFTVHYALRRDSADRHDVALSTGQPGATRRFLVLGVDSENRAYCNFTGDDLRSGAWYPDTVWHRYTCTYDATTRVRKLYRDGTLVSQDIALSAFTPPAGPVWLGRRADTMVGLNGAIADVVVENRVWSDAEVAAAIVPGALAAHAPQLGSSPNRAVLRCDTSATCPRIERNPTGAHNGPYAVFSAQDRYTLGNIAANGAVTLSLWAKPHRLDHDQMLAARVNPDGSGMYLAIESGALSCSFVTGSGVTRAVRTITEALTADELDLWHMYSCAYDNTLHRARLFRDGVSVASANSIPALTFSTGVVFGAQPATTTIAEGELTLPIDDIAVYDTMLSDAKVWLLYADTLPDPTLPTHTSVPGVTLTTSPVPSATQTFTALPTAPRTRTRLLASLTPTNAPFPTQTATPSFTRSRTATRTQTPTRTLSLTPSETLTRTATVSTRTLVTTASRTPTITRTPLVITRTWMAKRSPTYGAQTRTATALMYQQTITAYRITQTAQARWTATRTLTAYPLPPTETVVAYPGP